ncbi:hypothetical protein OXX59_000550 [Metschnikowia pulcherrima]
MKFHIKPSALAFCVAAVVGASMVSDESPECSVKLYDSPPPVACSYSRNPYLNLPEEPSIVNEGKDGLSVEVPAASDGYVYELTGFYQATETREYSFSISESTVATMQLGFQSSDTREFHELISTEVHSLSYEKTTTFRMEKGETYPLRFAFCSDNGILPIYITEEGGETREINTEIKQVSYEKGSQEGNGSGISNKTETVSDRGDFEETISEEGTKEEGVAQKDISQESAANNVSSGSASSEAQYYPSEFYYTCYSAPKDEVNEISERSLTDLSDLQVVSEGLSNEVETGSDTTKVDAPRIIEITGFCSAPADGSYTIIMPSGFIASLQIGPATTTKEQSCTVSEEWRVLDTRLYAAAEFEFSREYYYPYRLVVLANEVDYRWDITQFDASGKEVDLLGIWNTAAESCPIASPFSARTGGNNVLNSNNTMPGAGMMVGNSSETGSDAKPQAQQGVPLRKSYAGFDCESFISQRFVHTGGNGLGEEYIGTVADCSTRVGACTSVHAMTYAEIEHEELGSKTWTRVEENYEVVQKSGGGKKGHASGPGATGKTDDKDVSFSNRVSDDEPNNLQGNWTSGTVLPGNDTTFDDNMALVFGNNTIAVGSTDVNQTDFQAYSGIAQNSTLNGNGTLTSDAPEIENRISGIEDTDDSHATTTPGAESETKQSSGESSDKKDGQPGKDSQGAETSKDGHGLSSSMSGHGAGSMNAGSGQKGSSGETSSSSQGGSSGHGGPARQGPAGIEGRVGQDAGTQPQSGGHGTGSNGSSNRPNGSSSGSSAGASGPQASSTPNHGNASGRKSGSEANGAPNNGSGASRGNDTPNRPDSRMDTSSGKDGRTRPGAGTNSGSGEEKSNGGARGESPGTSSRPHDRTPKNGMPGSSSGTSDGLTQGTTAPSSGDRPHKSSESDGSNKSEKPEKSGKPTGSDESAKSGKSDKSNNTDRPSSTGQPGQAGGKGEAGNNGGTRPSNGRDAGSRSGHGDAGEGSPSLRSSTDNDTPHGSANGTSSASHGAPGNGSQGQGASTQTNQGSVPGEHKAGHGDGKSGNHAGPDGKDKSESHDGGSSVSGPGMQGRMGSDNTSTETSGSANKTGPKGVPYSDDLRGTNTRGVDGHGKPTSGPEAPKNDTSPGRGSTAAISSTYDGAGAKSTSALSFVVGLCLVLLF